VLLGPLPFKEREISSMSVTLTAREKGKIVIIDVSGRLTFGEGNNLLREKMWELLECGFKQVILSIGGIYSHG
jgi:hypothetical protein